MPHESMDSRDFTARRIAARDQLLESLTAASRRHGASAAHLIGSLGRQSADTFSDIDAWLTFADDRIEAAIQQRHDLYRMVGDVLLVHEAPSNRPMGGIYTLALYQSPAGPIQVDWYLAPQLTSHVTPQGRSLFEEVPVPRGEWQLDQHAAEDATLSDTITWLIAMLFTASKTLMRGEDPSFLSFLGDEYRDVQERHGVGQWEATEPTSLDAVVAMLEALAPLCDPAQQRARCAVETYVRGLLNRV